MRDNGTPPRLDPGAASLYFTKLTTQKLHKSPIVRNTIHGPLREKSGKGGLT